MNDQTKTPNAPEDDAGDLARLRALPSHDVAPALAARVHARGATAFDAAHGEGAFADGFARAWSRFGVPLVLAGVACVYIGWAVQATSALYR